MNSSFRSSVLLLLGVVALQGQEKLGPLAARLRDSVDVDRAMNVMRQVYARDRWFTFPKFRETAEYLAGQMRRSGLRDVEIIAPPADGRTQYGYWTMPLAWDVKSARLEIVSPAVSAPERVLADYAAVPASLGMWSGPTPPGGLEAEIVHIADGRPETIAATPLRGRFVLSDVNPSGIKWLLVKHGAAGAVNAFTENRDLVDGRQWVNAWGDKGWGFLEGDTPMPLFSVTPRQSQLLKRLLAQGPVRLRAVADTRLYRGEYPYVTGRVRGTGNEEVLTLGHMAEPGAHDNATGVAAMVEALSALERLIRAGRLARPRRSIRMLAMGELYGTMHYLTANPGRVKNTVAAITLDTPAGPYEMAGTEYTFHLNPHVAASYVDALILEVARVCLPGRPFHWKEFMPGTDSFLGEPSIGIPTVWPYSGSGVHTHHNSEDKPETVDPRSLRDLTIITAAYLYAIADAGEADAAWLASLAGRQAVDRIMAQKTARRARYLGDRGRDAVLSVLRVAPGARAALQPALDRVQQAVSQAVRALPADPPSAPDAALAEAASIVVRRNRLGTIPLDDLPQERWAAYPSGAWGRIPQLALFWCDGKRNLAEVIQQVELEAGPVQVDLTAYFRFLQQHGYVEFVR